MSAISPATTIAGLSTEVLLGTSIPASLAATLTAHEKLLKTRPAEAEDLVQARGALRESLYRFIISSPHEAAAADLDSKLWRLVFYEPLGHYRKLMQGGKARTAPSAMVQIIMSGIGLYSTLIDTVSQQTGIADSTSLALLEFFLFTADTGTSNVPAKEEKKTPSVKELANAAIDEASVRLMLYRMIINLGDLYRYAAQYCPKEASMAAGLSFVKSQAKKPTSASAIPAATVDLRLALEVYGRAQDFVPDHGNAYNQAAVVSSMLEEEHSALPSQHQAASLRTLYLYVTALVARNGFGKLAASNLRAYLRKDRGPPDSPLALLCRLARKKLELAEGAEAGDLGVGEALHLHQPSSSLDPLEWIYAVCIVRFWLQSRSLTQSIYKAALGALKERSSDGTPILHEAHLLALAISVDLLDGEEERGAVMESDFPDAVHPVAGWQRLVRPYLGYTPESPESLLESVISKGTTPQAAADDDVEMLPKFDDEKDAAYLTEEDEEGMDDVGPMPRPQIPREQHQAEDLSKASASLLAQLLSSGPSNPILPASSSQPAQLRSPTPSSPVSGTPTPGKKIPEPAAAAAAKSPAPQEEKLPFTLLCKPVPVKVSTINLPVPENIEAIMERVKNLPLSERVISLESEDGDGVPLGITNPETGALLRIYSQILFNDDEVREILKNSAWRSG